LAGDEHVAIAGFGRCKWGAFNRVRDSQIATTKTRLSWLTTLVAMSWRPIDRCYWQVYRRDLAPALSFLLLNRVFPVTFLATFAGACPQALDRLASDELV